MSRRIYRYRLGRDTTSRPADAHPNEVQIAMATEPWRMAAIHAHASWAARRSRCPLQADECRRPGCVHTAEIDATKASAEKGTVAAQKLPSRDETLLELLRETRDIS